MNHWWRAYNEAVNDPKLQLISDSLFRTWFNLMCIASGNDGHLPSLSSLAFTLRMKPEKVAQALAQLCSHGLLDKTATGFEPHNWNGRQYKSDKSDETAAQRMARYRERKRNERNAAVTVTATREQTTDTDTELEQKETREVALSVREPSDFEIFWREWPNKVGKPSAMKALASALRRGAEFAAIMRGIQSYIRDKPPDRPWLNPATFLNQNRWEDQPAQVQNGKTSNIIQATDNLVSILDSFDRGASETYAIRGPESPANVRLLSKGRG